MFRKIEQKDREFYINSVREFYSSEAVLHKIPDSYIEKTFEELMKSNVYLDCYIFEKENQKAGYALLAKSYSQEAGGICVWLDEIYILPEFRSCGLGGKFLNFIEGQEGISRVRLELCESNEIAHKVYQKHNFEELNYKQMIYEKKEP